MINFDHVTKENLAEHNPIWQQIPDQACSILKKRKTSLLFDLVNQQPDIDKIHLNARDPYKAKY